MLIMFFVSSTMNFELVLIYYTDDGSLELGSETSGHVAYFGNILQIREISKFAKVNKATMSLTFVVFILRFIYWQIALPSK